MRLMDWDNHITDLLDILARKIKLMRQGYSAEQAEREVHTYRLFLIARIKRGLRKEGLLPVRRTFYVLH